MILTREEVQAMRAHPEQVPAGMTPSTQIIFMADTIEELRGQLIEGTGPTVTRHADGMLTLDETGITPIFPVAIEVVREWVSDMNALRAERDALDASDLARSATIRGLRTERDTIRAERDALAARLAVWETHATYIDALNTVRGAS